MVQEEGDRKTNLIVNYLPQTMTQVVRIQILLLIVWFGLVVAHGENFKSTTS